MDTKDGGPAFPFPVLHGKGAPQGMSLRDWYAGQALAGLIAGGSEEHYEPGIEPFKNFSDRVHRTWAEWCYEMADAMIKVRDKREG